MVASALARAPRGRVVGTLRVGGPQISDVQRARMLRAATEIVGELGYGGMSVARVTSRAGVSRRTFYDLFDDREDCFRTVFEESLGRMAGVMADAAATEVSWLGRVRAGLTALLGFLDDEPAQGSLVVVDALGAGSRVLKVRARAISSLIAIVDEGRATPDAAHATSPLTAEGVVGAVLAVVHARMLERDRRPLSGLLNPLMGMIALPYLGAPVAAQELARPVIRPMRRRRRAAEDPFDGLGIRLTYRTLRALAAIAASPGASNRLIADSAGVQDQGQISKLLGRLENLGLIFNGGKGQARGEPNAWSLTPKGEEVERSIRAQGQETGSAT
jgi:AcrR family transcriptional regulator